MPGASQFKYRFGLSFPGQIQNGRPQAGDFRRVVEPVAEFMAANCANQKDLVLYDLYHQGEFAGPGLDSYLPAQYQQCELIAVFLCKDYTEKQWCLIEWQVIQSIVNDPERRNRVMYLWTGERDDRVLKELGLDWYRDGFLPIDQLTPKQIWDGIYQHYQKRSGPDQGRPGNSPLGQGSRAVPELLPYLADRHQQEQMMIEELQHLVAAQPARPLVVILHGADDQKVERFRDRFFRHSVASLFGGSLPVREFYLPWPFDLKLSEGFTEQFLQSILQRLLGGGAAAAQLQALASPAAGAVVLWSNVSTEEWGREGARLVEQVCRFWKENELVASQRLIHWISICYLKPPEYQRRNLLLHLFWDRWRHQRQCRERLRLNDQIRACINSLAATPRVAATDNPDHAAAATMAAESANAVVLPELESVRRSDAEGWVHSQPVRDFLNDQGVLRLEDEVRQFYRRWESERRSPHIPMEELARFLHDQLRAASSP